MAEKMQISEDSTEAETRRDRYAKIKREYRHRHRDPHAEAQKRYRATGATDMLEHAMILLNRAIEADAKKRLAAQENILP